jgi:hypothetical protein
VKLTAPLVGRLPNFFLLGANKAGTTSLWRYLRAHPDVFMPAMKEPHWFVLAGQPPPPQRAILLDHGELDLRTEADYRRLFRRAWRQKAVGEASTGYLTSPTAAAAIRQAVPDAKLIAVLRNPVDRAWSRWRMLRADGIERSDFLAAVQANPSYVGLGLYGAALERWFRLYPRERIQLFLYEELEADAAAVVRSILAFLDVDVTVAIDVSERHHEGRPEGPIPAEARHWLTEAVRADVEQLQRLLDRDLSVWLADPAQR